VIGHMPRLDFGVATDGTPVVHPACDCGWVSTETLDRADPRGVEPALDIWRRDHWTAVRFYDPSTES